MAGIENTLIFSSGEKLQPSTSQDIIGMQSVSTDVARINHTGDPNGVVSANPSSLCHDPVSGLVYFKSTGTGNTGWIPATGVLSLGNLNINFLNTGVIPLFTTVNRSFLITGFAYLGIDISNVIVPGSFNMGWTAPDYDDYFTTFGTPIVPATGNIQVTLPPSADTIIVPPLTTFSINVVTATTATTDTEKVCVQGFYI